MTHLIDGYPRLPEVVVDMFCMSQELVAESKFHLELDEDTEFDIK